MKKLFSALLAGHLALLLAVPAFADAALPPHYAQRYFFMGGIKVLVAVVVGVVIVAVGIIVVVVRDRQRQITAEQQARAAEMDRKSDDNIEQ